MSSSNVPLDAAKDYLAELAAYMGPLEPSAEPLQVMSLLSQTLERVMTEHEGMTEEVLSLYEQLGVVFEVCRKLPTVQNEPAVIELFVDCLKRRYHQCLVDVAIRGPDGSWRQRSDFGTFAEQVAPVIEKAVRQSTVVVESLIGTTSGMTKTFGSNAARRPIGADGESGVSEFGHEEVLVGPIRAGTTLVCAVVLIRPVLAPSFRACDMLLLESLTTFCGDLIRNHRLTEEMRRLSVTMVRSLVNAVDQKDEYTSGHSLRVAYYATLLGRDLGMGGRDLQMLQWSALLHDVGKIGIRDDVLKKCGRLTDEEFTHMKEHPVRSHQVVQAVAELSGALDGILHHHERFDGRGYPSGLTGTDIPVQARIIQVADIFDALTSTRSYRAAYDWNRALEIMRSEAGQSVDPELYERFDRLIRRQIGDGPDGWISLVRRAGQFEDIVTVEALH